jgi:diguanylate cyclase (GGDEF)-like protein
MDRTNKIIDIMQKNVIAVPPTASLYECAELMTVHKIGSIVVVNEDERPINILTKTDFVRAMANSSLALSVEEFCRRMTKKDLKILKENQSLFDLLALFTRYQIKHVPIVDNSNGTLKGIISSTDILCTLTELVTIDPLTRLANRRHLTSVKFKLMRKIHSNLGILMLDLDNFKQINDQYGHQFGDKVLKQVASTISTSVRTYDDAIRYGGEEFLIILYRLQPEDTIKIAERIRKNVEQITFEENPDAKVTVSIGLTFFDTKLNNSLDEAIKNADTALYQAKQQGKNRVFIFEKDKLCGQDNKNSPAKNRNSQITASGDRRTGNDFK